jgi:hypothetical protein
VELIVAPAEGRNAKAPSTHEISGGKMKTSIVGMFTVSAIILMPYFVFGQQADLPQYKRGDWWKVKTEFEAKVSSRNEGCQDSYKEWIVKIDEKTLARLYGINEGKEVESICDAVLGWVLGTNESKRLKFPLSVGQTWTHRFERRIGKRSISVEPQYKVTAWEKVETPKGTFEAFKITGAAKWVTPGGGQNFNNWTEYYSPAVKAMVLSESETVATKRKVMLIDFNVSN